MQVSVSPIGLSPVMPDIYVTLLECSTLKDELRSVCAALTSACHPVVPEFDVRTATHILGTSSNLFIAQVELQRLLVLDSEMFGPLLGSPTA